MSDDEMVGTEKFRGSGRENEESDVGKWEIEEREGERGGRKENRKKSREL